MTRVLDDVDEAVRTDVDSVGAAAVEALAPGLEEVAVLVELQHRVRPAHEDVDVVVAVDGDSGDLVELVALWDFRPVVIGLEGELVSHEEG